MHILLIKFDTVMQNEAWRKNNFSLQDERLPFFASQDFFMASKAYGLTPISNDATQYAYEDLLNSSEKKSFGVTGFLRI